MLGGSVFSGIGMLDYGLHLAGLEHAWMCEWDPWRRDILAKRFQVPVYDDIRNVGAATAAPVRWLAGGFPCKGASTSGKRNGFEHAETVLWHEMARAVGELEPAVVIIENVANILGMAAAPGEPPGSLWGVVLGDLAALGFDVVWDCLPAAAVGAPHLRDRVLAVASHPARTHQQRDRDKRGCSDGRSDAERGRDGVAPDPSSPCGQAARTRRSALGGTQPDGPEPPPDAHSSRAHADAAGRGPRTAVRERDPQTEAPTDPSGERRQQERRGPSGDEGADERRSSIDDHEPAGPLEAVGVAVEWGEYESAIRRWEAVAGTAPEPLLRGVDARPARRVVKSRLSALGDGVQVQVGYLAGCYARELLEGGA